MKDLSVGMVVFTASGSTDFLEGAVSLQADTLQFSVGDKRFGIPIDALQRIATDKLPSAFPKRFAEGLQMQWQHTDGRRRAVVEADRDDLWRFTEAVGRACLDETNRHVEQRRVPMAFETDTPPETVTKATSMRVRPAEQSVTFDADGLVSIRLDFVTTVETLTLEFDGDERIAVAVKLLTPDEEVTSRILPGSDRLAGLLRDYLVNSYVLGDTGGPIRVLLVDDEPGLTDIARLHLREHHAELSLRTTTTTTRAKQLVRQEAFECIVSDYEMPEGGAPEILAEVRESSADVPFIVFSRRSEDDIPEEDTLHGVDAWIEKEMGTDQYLRLAQLIKRLVLERRSGESATND